MLTIQGCRARQQRLLRVMEENGWDLYLTANYRTVYYFSGLLGPAEVPALFAMDKGGRSFAISCVNAEAAAGEVIEVSEDGRGLDPEGLRNAVVKKGLMTRDEVDSLSDREAQELIFLPGFSTAAVTTDVSGRGVGMDAVRAKINGLNGSVEIISEVGKGSRFVIRLPLTLAIIQALLVKGAGEVYALPLEAIEETVVIDRTDTRPVDGVECMVLRDHIVPLVSLRERLGLYGMEEEGDKYSVVVVRTGTARLGVVVDQLVGQQDIVIKHLPEYLGDVRGVAGATILGDGSVALIVDVGALGDRRGVAA